MDTVLFWGLSLVLAWFVGRAQGHHNGVLEGQAKEMLKRAGFERPMLRRKP